MSASEEPSGPSQPHEGRPIAWRIPRELWPDPDTPERWNALLADLPDVTRGCTADNCPEG